MINRPLLLSAISFAFGILLYELGLANSFVLFCASIYLIGALFIAFKYKKTLLVVICIFSSLLGFYSTDWKFNAINNLNLPFGEKATIEFTVKDVKRAETNQQLNVIVNKINGQEKTLKMSIITFDVKTTFIYGDEIYAICSISSSKHSINRTFTYSSGFISTAFMNDGTFEIIGNSASNYDFEKLCFDGRKQSKDVFSSLFDQDQSAVAQGITIGDTSGYTTELKDAFKDAGLSHISAVSGMNITLIILLVSLLLSNLFKKNIFLNLILVIFIIGFGYFVRWSPSVTRAVIMALTIIISKAFWRRADLLTSLAIASLITLIINPYAIFNVGFQLSFAAVIGLAIFVAPFVRTIQNSNFKLINIILPSIAVLLSTAYITSIVFGNVNLTSIWANVLILPLVDFASIFSYLILLLSTISIQLAEILAFATRPVLWAIVSLTRLVANHTAVGVNLPTPNYFHYAIYFALLYLFYAIEKEVTNKWSKEL